MTFDEWHDSEGEPSDAFNQEQAWKAGRSFQEFQILTLERRNGILRIKLREAVELIDTLKRDGQQMARDVQNALTDYHNECSISGLLRAEIAALREAHNDR